MPTLPKLCITGKLECVHLYPQLGGFTPPQSISYDVSRSNQTIMYVRSVCN